MGLAEMNARLDELAALPDGWLDGDGKAINPAAMARIRAVLAEVVSMGMPAPRLYPTESGGIEAEWDSGGWSISAEYEPGPDHLWLLAFCLDSNGMPEKYVALADPGCAKELAAFVQQAQARAS